MMPGNSTSTSRIERPVISASAPPRIDAVLGQRHAEERVDVDAVGRLGELDQRAVDVEEQRVRVQ
jgi:hypothetical protein